MPTTKRADAGGTEFAIRPLTEGDLAAVIEIDSLLSGRPRGGFFERRLKAALAEPKRFIYVGAALDGRLCGFALVRLVSGEFGGDDGIAQLDAIGVHPESQGHGAGSALVAEIDRLLRAKGIAEMQSQSDWRDSDLLHFFEGMGFAVGSRLVLARQVGGERGRELETATEASP